MYNKILKREDKDIFFSRQDQTNFTLYDLCNFSRKRLLNFHFRGAVAFSVTVLKIKGTTGIPTNSLSRDCKSTHLRTCMKGTHRPASRTPAWHADAPINIGLYRVYTPTVSTVSEPVHYQPPTTPFQNCFAALQSHPFDGGKT